MLNYIWPILILASFIYAIFSGNVQNLNSSIFESLEEVITLSMTLVGTMCLWCGLMEIVKNTSIMKKIIRMLRPVLNWLFPESKNNEEAMENISMNTISNILGLGNASTPAGIKAMESLQEKNKNKQKLSNSMLMLIVLNTTSIELIPTTVIAIRTSLNAQNPADIIIPIWFATIIGTVVGVISTKILIKRSKNK